MKKSCNESFIDHNLRVSCLISGDLSIVVDGSSRLTVLNSVDVRWRREWWCSLVTRSAWVAADAVITETWSNVYIWVSLVMRTRINRKFQWCQGLADDLPSFVGKCWRVGTDNQVRYNFQLKRSSVHRICCQHYRLNNLRCNLHSWESSCR